MLKCGGIAKFLTLAVAAGAVGGLLLLISNHASADDAQTGAGDGIISAEGPPAGLSPPPPPRDFFALYPSGEGDAVTLYEQLDLEASNIDATATEGNEDAPAEAVLEGGTSRRAALDSAGLWAETEHGHAVHNRWSGVSRQKRDRARTKRAAQLSGVQGLDELGVQ